MKKKGTIQITLKSDLCVSSGYSYAGIIDSDICYDSCGIPYIPGKRLKGCMRAAAEELLYSVISEEVAEQIFGKTGKKCAEGIVVGNAYIKDYAAIYSQLEEIERCYTDSIKPQDILAAFSHVQAQTSVKDGVAIDTTLRFTRVLNQHAPYQKEEELVFYAEILYDDAVEEELQKIVKATRNIGLKRNRGLGSVVCELVDNTCAETKNTNDMQKYEAEQVYEITYNFCNEEPLFLSSNSDTHSEKYISGQRILGYLAKRYLEDNSADSDEFRDLFLNGTVKYTNAYLCKNGHMYYPAPEYINRLKKTKKLVNSLCYDEEKDYGEEYKTGDGNQPKKLKNKFVYMNEANAVDVADVDLLVVYHHSNKSESRDGTKGILYSIEVVRERQNFLGVIYAPGKYIKKIVNLLQQGKLQFGKSITAQYGSCVLNGDIQISPASDVQKVSAGSEILITFLSDGIFVNENGAYTVYKDEIERCVIQQLGIKASTDDKTLAILQTKEIHGYQSTWNLRKVPVPAIKAGSCMVIKVLEDAVITTKFIGERNLEGYGQIRIDYLSKMNYVVEQYKAATSDCRMPDKVDQKVVAVLKPILIQSILNELCSDKLNNSSKLFPTSLGRVTLMLSEALDEHEDADVAFKDFVTRVLSIKSKKSREEIQRNALASIGTKSTEIIEVEKYGKKVEMVKENWKFKGLPAVTTDNGKKKIEILKALGMSEDEIKAELDKRWGDYLLLIFTYQKYKKKLEGGSRSE